MTPTEVYRVLNDAFPGGVQSDANGISLRGVLRVERGSGIAGRGGVWAITFPGAPSIEPITNIRTPKQLRRALAALIVDVVRIGESLGKLWDGKVGS